MKLRILITLLVFGNTVFSQDEKVNTYEIGINQNVTYDYYKDGNYKEERTFSISKFTPSFSYTTNNKTHHRFELTHFDFDHIESQTTIMGVITSGYINNTFEIGIDYSLYYKIKSFSRSSLLIGGQSSAYFKNSSTKSLIQNGFPSESQNFLLDFGAGAIYDIKLYKSLHLNFRLPFSVFLFGIASSETGNPVVREDNRRTTNFDIDLIPKSFKLQTGISVKF